ncbi:MAG: polysaccharide lyase 6 family protein [Alistipes sp.]|nr:polysaccharide lyase 6 family protein [Alistipes sp.]
MKMRKYILTVLLLTLVFGCSGSDFKIPSVVTPEQPEKPDEEPDKKPEDPSDPAEPADPAVRYVSSAAELKALGTLTAGDVVVWRDGVYDAQTVTLNGAGTADNPVVLRAETPGGVRFTGTSRLSIGGQYVEASGFWWENPEPVKGKSVVTFAKGSSDCVLADCAITGDATAEDATTDTKWVSLYGTHNTVRDCTFRDKRNIGCLLVVWLETGIVPEHTVAGNRFERPVTLYDAAGKAINGQETIRIGTSDYSMQTAACTVEGNYFYHCHGEQAEIISNKSCGNFYHGNLFVESQGSLTLRHGNGCTVRGNSFLGNGLEGTGGIRIIGEDHVVEENYLQGLAGTGYRTAVCLVRGQQSPALNGYWQVKNARVRRNTIVDCKYAFNVNYASSGSDQVMPVVGTLIEDNVVSLSSSSSYAVYCTATPAPDIEWKNNTLYGGRQSGVELPTAAEAPILPDMPLGVDALRLSAGCSWKTE